MNMTNSTKYIILKWKKISIFVFIGNLSRGKNPQLHLQNILVKIYKEILVGINYDNLLT